MDIHQLRHIQVKPVLKEIEDLVGIKHTKEAEDLVLETICQESLKGHYIKQEAFEPFSDNRGGFSRVQIELRSAKWIMKYIKRKGFSELIDKFYNPKWSLQENLLWQDAFPIMLCRLYYYSKRGAIPKDLRGRAEYWKKYYNTKFGAGTVEKYIENNS